jgi:hypothetical protein
MHSGRRCGGRWRQGRQRGWCRRMRCSSKQTGDLREQVVCKHDQRPVLAGSSVGFDMYSVQNIVLDADAEAERRLGKSGGVVVGCQCSGVLCERPSARAVCRMATGLNVTHCESCLLPLRGEGRSESISTVAASTLLAVFARISAHKGTAILSRPDVFSRAVRTLILRRVPTPDCRNATLESYLLAHPQVPHVCPYRGS